MKLITSFDKALITTLSLTFLVPVALQAQGVEATPTKSATAIAAEASEQEIVARAIFTTAVEDGEPTDYLSEVDNTVPEVFFFTELEGLAGETVMHRWKHEGVVMATANFNVSGDPDKVWSGNKMKPEWTGAWEVEVVDGRGKIIGRGEFALLAPL